MNTHIVLGLGYGDEGKGLVTDALCARSRRPLVIRFSGGHQAGHTVTTPDGRRHVFSQIGSGAFAGAATYWSRWCTWYPVGMANELAALRNMEVFPRMFIDALAPVTTPYDLAYNRYLERQQRHGSCGLGFGATMERHETTPYKLYAQDIFFPTLLPLRMEAIARYYEDKTRGALEVDPALLEAFAHATALLVEEVKCVHEGHFFRHTAPAYSDLVFEGSQGILLDRDHGFFPHVTRAHTTSMQAMGFIREYGLPMPEIYYLTRAYQTRHGAGPMTYEDTPPELEATPNETNQYNEWQGHLRRAILDQDLLAYALQCDQNYSAGAGANLVITCCDQLAGPMRVAERGQVRALPGPEALADLLPACWHQVWLSEGPTRAHLKQQAPGLAR